MAGHLGRELGRSYPFPVQGLHLNQLPAVPHHEPAGGFLPEAFNGATPGQGYVFKPDYGPPGGMMDALPGGGDAPRVWYPLPTGMDAWGHHPGMVMGPYGVVQSGEACPGPKPDIKVERDCDEPGPYFGHPWAGGCVLPPTPTLARTAPSSSQETVTPDYDIQPPSSPASEQDEIGSADSSPQSDGSQSPEEPMVSGEIKEEVGSGDEELG
uniref:Uncharacterized protein n=1 Tax=Sphaerodactylus townsendi TaxID=933632 RepID=A0ACB8EGJ1_9SAUR